VKFLTSTCLKYSIVKCKPLIKISHHPTGGAQGLLCPKLDIIQSIFLFVSNSKAFSFRSDICMQYACLQAAAGSLGK